MAPAADVAAVRARLSAGAALDVIRIRELVAMTPEVALAIAVDLLGLLPLVAPSAQSSGLLEQQRIFRRGTA